MNRVRLLEESFATLGTVFWPRTILYSGRMNRPAFDNRITAGWGDMLFVDEWPEFGTRLLQMMRYLVGDQQSIAACSAGTSEVPSILMFIGAMNPSPCGWRGDLTRVYLHPIQGRPLPAEPAWDSPEPARGANLLSRPDGVAGPGVHRSRPTPEPELGSCC